MDEHDHEDQDFPEVEHRLLAFGSAPLASGVADRTLERVRAAGRPKMSGARLKFLSAAALAGFAAGGVGIAAAANVLPAPAQDVAHNALDAVGVHVPPGHVRYNDPTACPGGPYANHGAYVRAHKDDPNAGASPCGKPVQSVGATGRTDTSDPNADKSDKGKAGKSNSHGPPAWAHGNGKPDDQNPNSGASPKTKPGKPSSAPPTASSTATSTASTTTTSASTSSTTSTTTQP
jgi:hypothetical protein